MLQTAMITRATVIPCGYGVSPSQLRILASVQALQVRQERGYFSQLVSNAVAASRTWTFDAMAVTASPFISLAASVLCMFRFGHVHGADSHVFWQRKQPKDLDEEHAQLHELGSAELIIVDSDSDSDSDSDITC